ncbi:MAG: xanthine dehydrogenase family protein molybdopterin-binding subunit, partial [Hyphomicrobiales bacterium]|nr:xanthine dehydrogenase family protein molybdopterin-binding subunit [Hyphomicrobiales bacterium]
KGILSTTGLVLAVSVAPPRRALAADAPKWGADGMPHGTVNDPKVFVSIAPDGTVTIVCHRSEMGTGVRTGMPLIVADEMEADWSRCKVAQAPGDEVRYGNQDTDGSRSTRHGFLPMRQVGAAARMMLEQAAANRWGVDVSDVEAQNHEVIQKSTGKKLGYGDLAADASKLPVPTAVAKEKMDTPSPGSLQLKDPSKFRYIGKEGTNIVDGYDITTGRAKYGQDIRLPDQKYAVVARPPVMGGKIAAFDATEAKKVPGVVQIVEIPAPSYPLMFQPSGGIAVVADNTWAAIQGRKALKIQWDDGPHATYDSQAYRAAMEATARQPGKILRSEGDFAAAFASADKKVEAEYYIPHNAHATMEPPAATCRIVDGKAEVWTSVQSPQAAHDLVAKYLGLPPENVTCNVTLLGGGFGRKSKPDFAVEAALCSKAMGGAPVKVVWTREDDIRNSFYHTVSVERLEAGLDKDGKVVAWRHNSVAPTIFSLFVADPKHEAPLEQGMGLVDMPFDIKNISIENGEAESHTKIVWWRSVSNIPHGFAIQSFAAELASAAGKDQKAFLLDLIGPPRILDVPQKVKSFWDYGENPEVYPIDTGRLRNVVELVTEKAGWGRQVPKGHGLGLAVHRSFVSYIAAVIEAAVDEKGNVTIPRVDIAIDCGPIVNPDRVRSQLEGAVVMGLGIGLMNEISFKDGKVQQSNLDDYQVMRISDAPRETHVYVVPHGYDVPLGGVGEPGVPPVAPALMNAIFAASGKRIRSLPLGSQLAGKA